MRGESRVVRALLLAAGEGSRLRPLTEQWPKCLMPVRGRPLLEYWLQALHAESIRDVLVNTHFHENHVRAFLARQQFVNWVKPVHEAELRGTAGTLRANIEFFREHTTLLVHADNWCQCDFGAFIDYHFYQRPAHCLITMMTFDTDAPQSCGIVETDEQDVVVAFHEKVANPPGKRANGAVYLLEPQVLERLERHPDSTDFSTQVLPQYMGRIATWHNAGIHRDIGTLSALRAAQRDPMPQLYWASEDDWQKRFQSSAIFSNLMSNLKDLEYSDE
jgi:mannose-1-phosphate guanylyltransferase